MARIIALDILRAASQHAQSIGCSGLAMMTAITTRWDSLGGTVAVRWSNRTMGEMTGLSKNTIPVVRSNLVKLGWLLYEQEGMHAGNYKPTIPSFHAQTSSEDPSNTMAQQPPNLGTSVGKSLGHHWDIHWEVAGTSLGQTLGTYTPSPVPAPEPILEKAVDRPRVKVPVQDNPPTAEQVVEYIAAQGYGLDAQEFHDANTRGGWTYGKAGKSKSLVYDWKAHVRTWESLRKKGSFQPKPQQVDYSSSDDTPIIIPRYSPEKLKMIKAQLASLKIESQAAIA